ncbi:MAG: hypothetical protein GC162_04520 [Planctomycetes bacterium]|nr:hypothetical protein [Planctomycetota bacterium]
MRIAHVPLCIMLIAAGASADAPLTIHTVAGTGVEADNGPAGPVASANIGQPFGVEFAPDGAMIVCEVSHHRLRRVDLKTGQVATIAGNGTKGYSGDGGPATQASMNEPYEVRFDDAGNLFVVERLNHIVRRVDAKTHVITTLAGTGQPGFAGDGGPATKAQLHEPHSIAIDNARHQLYIADIKNNRIRRVDLNTGIIETVAGNGEKKLPTDGQIAADHPMAGPRALCVQGRTLWIALREGNSVWSMNLDTGKLQHIAGTGKSGYAGDGGPALAATMNGPKGIVADDHHHLYITDTENQVIRVIDTANQTIDTIAGSGPKARGDGGDGGPATSAKLDRPHGIGLGPDGRIYIGDTNNHRVRVLEP